MASERRVAGQRGGRTLREEALVDQRGNDVGTLQVAAQGQDT